MSPAQNTPHRNAIQSSNIRTADTTKALLLTLTAEEPLVITDGSAESIGHQTLEYIPGSMLLGAFAFAWRAQHPNDHPDSNEEFCSFFLSNAASWGHAYPTYGDKPCVPIPLCFQKVKNFNGLLAADDDIDPKTGCVINLLPLEQDSQLDEILRQSGRQVDAIKLKKLGRGFMSADCLRTPLLYQHWNMHVAIASNRKAADRQLFGFSSLAPQSEFCSVILCSSEEIQQQLLHFLKAIPSICVGHARSAGYGKLRLTNIEATSLAQDFTPSPDQATFFLLSDYIPARSWEQPLQSLMHELESALGCTIAPSEKTKLFCDYSVLASFNNMWSLPRRSVTTLVKGSVFSLNFEGTVQLPQYICLGSRQNEGYGRIWINPGFINEDIVVEAKSTACPSSRPSANRQDDTPAEQNILHAIRHRALLRQAQEAAIAFVATPQIKSFLESVFKEQQPSYSQLGNMRQLISSKPHTFWKNAFEHVLQNSPCRGGFFLHPYQ